MTTILFLYEVVCKKGQYYNITNKGCLDCTQGHYQDKENQYMCYPCGAGLTNYAEGMSACVSKLLQLNKF